MIAVTGLVLAGGQGSRMGGVDKGLAPFRGKPMVAHAIERLAPQVDEVLVNANRNPEAYARFGHRVVADEIPGFAGPLAGFERGLAHARGQLVATVPCDSPFLPADLVARLRVALEREGAQLAVARTGDQPHPVFCLMRREVHASLAAFLASGQRKIDKWYASLAVVEVAFDDEADAFANINTRDELAGLEKPT
ncbi:MAG TPA: molybdenum cofactor guanylyltransferase MobA [Usitatibacteraceae bacterium]|jgi:molybdopterin-guanine dinucleotide biosynthesis protein A|nr:molybdenum cofactor guanylyltransferase MobA [Burkholderiales bacterium]MBZ0248203.1 molybdenum cofactor guanylyltransferase MobA [Burkholderiales bacterium]HQY48138.1 molybdenum cofactor guanylyltransferase MobA [Usitatibacteraceae bacterium]HRA23775.1 molybdenum cofactor guanylyltransferase MobA [Usitatibacteraceae bacterium]